MYNSYQCPMFLWERPIKKFICKLYCIKAIRHFYLNLKSIILHVSYKHFSLKTYMHKKTIVLNDAIVQNNRYYIDLTNHSSDCSLVSELSYTLLSISFSVSTEGTSFLAPARSSELVSPRNSSGIALVASFWLFVDRWDEEQLHLYCGFWPKYR